MNYFILILLTSAIIYFIAITVLSLSTTNFDFFGPQSLGIALICGFVLAFNIKGTSDEELMLIENSIASDIQMQLTDFKEKTDESIDYSIARSIDDNLLGKDFKDLDIDLEKKEDVLKISYKLKIKYGIFGTIQVDESFVVNSKEILQESNIEDTKVEEAKDKSGVNGTDTDKS